MVYVNNKVYTRSKDSIREINMNIVGKSWWIREIKKGEKERNIETYRVRRKEKATLERERATEKGKDNDKERNWSLFLSLSC